MTFVTHPNQKRSACERCRRQKLRCSRQDSDETRCSRCARLDFNCIAGQQRRIGRPSRARLSENATPTRRPEGDEPANDAAAVGSAAGPEIHARPIGFSAENDPLTEPPASGTGAPPLDPNETIYDLFEFDELPWDDGIALAMDQNSTLVNLTLEADVVDAPPIDPATQHKALAKLSKINVDLHSYLSNIEMSRDRLDFCAFTHPESSLSVAGVTIIELTLVAFQDVVGVLSDLQGACLVHRESPTTHTTLPVPLHPARDCLGNQPGSSAPSMTPESSAFSALVPRQTGSRASGVIGQPLALIVTSCYIQIIGLLEEILIQIHERLGVLPAGPVGPIEGIKFGAVPIGDGRLQGLIFIQIVTSLLDKAERHLGVHPPDVSPVTIALQPGLLSPSQSGTLRDQLRASSVRSSSRPTWTRDFMECIRSTLANAATF